MASSSSDPASASFRQPKHEVFLSFRGEDTRNNFLYHLYEAFRRKGIGAYADFKELPRGEEISQALVQAIEKSMISIIVFSQNYATSSWCLDELSKIMECWNSRGQLVIPIFYHVYPSDVRNQTDSFGEAFVEHERSKKDKVQEWKRALKEAGNLSGFTLTGDMPEPIVIEEIVHDVLNKLNRLSKRDYKGLIGIGSPVEQIKSLLCIGGDQDVRIIGIWGMGGIGKTTLAQVVYDEVSAQFESCYFLANVREQLERDGVIALRDKLLSKLLNEENLHISTPMIGSTFIKNRRCRKRVLIVFDDVNDIEQLEIFALSHDHFGFGSRIIITSRDKHVLVSGGSVDGIYKVEELSYNDSLQLFSLFAFKQNHLVDDFKDLSNSFLEYTKGVPIAIKVLGSTLHQKSIEYWESALTGLKQYPNRKIQNVLKVSFDGLQELEKNIFLDIACFFKGYDRDYVTKILEGCYGSIAFCGITNLIDKCLLNDNLGMHDLIQEMGRNVVLARSPYPEERSRLWTQDDIRQVLENGEGTKSIQGMLLGQSQIDEIRLHPGAFARMRHLRIIKFNGKGGKLVPLDSGLESLPNELRYFHWEYCMLKSPPSKFRPEKLVELRLPNSKVEQLWNGKQDLVNLRLLDLYRCKNLTRIPDLSAARNIGRLSFSGCKSLVELPSMIHMKYLERHMHADWLYSLKKFPELPQQIKSLHLGHTVIEEIPESIGCLNQLASLGLHSSRIHNLPSVIVQLDALKKIHLSDCPNITEFPNVPEGIRELWLDNTPINEVPSSISRLKSLCDLSMRGCRKLESLPTTICQLKSLEILSLEGCTNLECFPEILKAMECLFGLNLGSRRNLSVPSSFCNSDFLEELNLSGSDIVEIPKGTKSIKVQRWRSALTEAGNLSGFTLTGDQPEPLVIEDIVLDIENKLTQLSKIENKGLIGIGPHMEEIKSMFCTGGDEGVRIIGIWGMDGIGKTTLAQAIYDEVSAEFEGCCFLANIREELEKHGANSLRDKLLSKLLNEENLHICTPMIGSTIIKDRLRLRRKKVLVVFDDVNDFNLIESLVISRDHFGFGSRIIVTSRDKQVLFNGRVDEIYEVKELSYHDSLRLFSLFAFKQNHPVDDFKDLSNSFLEYCKGIPLALKVLGSTLYRQSIAYWESSLNRLRQYPNPTIQNVLKISFDGLPKEEKDIFLDIACFFKGDDRDYVTKILEGCCGSIALCGITSLINKCLLNVTNENKLGMHDLIQEMGKAVVCAESPYPEKRSRLWTPDDIHQLLENGKGTKSIKGILLDQSKIDEVQLHPHTFTRVHYIKFIKFTGNGCKLVPHQGLESLPNELRSLHWEHCPLKSLPLNFSPENLVELILPKSNVEQLWNGEQNLVNLRVLDLQYCENLTRIPDLSTAINLETLSINGCESLVELPSMIHLKSLQDNLCIKGCNNLKKFPELPWHTKMLDFCSTAIEEIPDSIGYLVQLLSLRLVDSRVKAVSKNICKLESLECFVLEVCPIVQFPEVPRNLKRLVLSWNQIEEVPSSIGRLNQLSHLDMSDSQIRNLPGTIVQLDALEEIKLSACPNLTKFPNVSDNIKRLSLNRTPIEEVPSSISRLKGLAHLSLTGCSKLKTLPTSICELKSLKTLNLNGCSNFECFPAILKTMGCLEYLNLKGTAIEVLLPSKSIKKLPNLLYLYLGSCKSLKSLPELPACLRVLDAGGSTSLERVPKWEQFQLQNMQAAGPDNYFMFNNCFNLDQDAVNNIMANAQFRIQRMAEEFAMESFKGVDHAYDRSIFCCLPGSEISNTFKNRSTNSSITVQLGPACSNIRFLGFVLCIVVDFEHHHDFGKFEVKCKYRLKTKCGDHHSFAYTWHRPNNFGHHMCFDSNHVILLSDGFERGIIKASRNKHFDEASFEFYVELNEEQIKVQKCGVDVFYVEALISKL